MPSNPSPATGALNDCIELLSSMAEPARPDPRFHDVIHALGMRIGFGVLMHGASFAWREHLRISGFPVGGEFVVGPCRASIETVLKLAQAEAANGSEKIDFAGEALRLKLAITPSACLATDVSTHADNDALRLIEGTLRLIAMLAVKYHNEETRRSDG